MTYSVRDNGFARLGSEDVDFKIGYIAPSYPSQKTIILETSYTIFLKR